MKADNNAAVSFRRPYRLGIDAGGTYTDAVVVDMASNKVLVSCKALTVPEFPARGIADALNSLNSDLLKQVSMASLATTFATNAMVEGRGAQAGLILIGYEKRPPNIPSETPVMMIKGGHTVSGDEKATLNEEELDRHLEPFLKGLDAVAICGFFSVRNPDHEERVAQRIVHLSNLPVVRGHRLSMRLDAVKRAATAWWNARLIPLITRLIGDTRRVLTAKGLQIPLMVVRGDGTLMSAETALVRPVDTLLSGPAASILGARFLSGEDNALVVDIGGTTTDLAVLENGRVTIDPQGAQVGQWKTHVEAAKVRTIGLGGDSLIAMDRNRKLVLGPRRVVPLCRLAQSHPEVLSLLQSILRTGDKNHGVNPCLFYGKLPDIDQVVALIPAFAEQNLVSEYLLKADTAQWASALNLKQFEQRGILFHSALTPTDIRVAAGELDLGNREASRLGLAIMARHFGVHETVLTDMVEDVIRRTLCLESATFVNNGNGNALAALLDTWYAQPTQKHSDAIGLQINLHLSVPTIGLGGPAGACLPKAFHRLHTQCILPDNYAVAVAVGAVAGSVDITETGKILPSGDSKFRLYTASGREICLTLEESIERGRMILETLAKERMKRNHITDPVIEYTAEKKEVTLTGGEPMLMEVDLTLRASGRANVWEAKLTETEMA